MEFNFPKAPIVVATLVTLLSAGCGTQTKVNKSDSIEALTLPERPSALSQPKRSSVTFDPQVPNIQVNEFMIASAQSKCPAITTTSVTACIAVFLYDPSTKIGCFAHFRNDANGRLGMMTLQNALREEGAHLANLQASVIGGSTTHKGCGLSSTVYDSTEVSAELHFDILTHLKENKINLVHHQPPSTNPYYHLQVDMRTGVVSDLIFDRNHDFTRAPQSTIGRRLTEGTIPERVCYDETTNSLQVENDPRNTGPRQK